MRAAGRDRAGGDLDAIRRGVELVLQVLIDVEATEAIRRTWRNGSRERLLATKAGDVELASPSCAREPFFPSILERRRRIDRALYAVVVEAYVHGVSTPRVDDLGHPGARQSGILQVRGVEDLFRPRRQDGGLPHLAPQRPAAAVSAMRCRPSSTSWRSR